MSTVIKMRCIDQVLTFESTPRIASGGLEEDFIQVSFCSKWDGMTKTAVFWRNEKDAYHVPLDESDSCAIPREVLADKGVIYFGLFGVSADGRQRTSEVMRYTIVKGAITSSTKPSDPTPDFYVQVLQKCAEIVTTAAEIKASEQAFEQAMTQQQTDHETAVKESQEAFEQAMTQRQTEHETAVEERQTAFEEAMTAAQEAFEQAMSQRQTEHETGVAAAQEAFEQAMVAAQEAYEAKVSEMVEDHILPAGIVTTEKLADNAVTAAKLATAVWVNTTDVDPRVGETLYLTDDPYAIMPGPYYNSVTFSVRRGFEGAGDNVYTDTYLALLGGKWYVAPDKSYVIYYQVEGTTTDSEAGTVSIPYKYVATAVPPTYTGDDPVTPEAIGAAPAIWHSTEDVTAGAPSPHPNGTLYVVIE